MSIKASVINLMGHPVRLQAAASHLFLTDPTSMVTYVCNCRCSPYIIINKLVESNSWTSDSNAYFPVPPCEYGGPREALAAGDYKAVFVMAEPEKIPRHNFYEGLWFMKTGLPRMVRGYLKIGGK